MTAKKIFNSFSLLVLFIIALIVTPFVAFGATDKISTTQIQPGNKAGNIVVVLKVAPPKISNEKLEVLSSGAMLLSWNTDIPSTSMVVYGPLSHKTTNPIVYSTYASSTKEVLIPVKKHTMLITRLFPNKQYFFRPVSNNNIFLSIGKEKTTPTLYNTDSKECITLKGYLKLGNSNNNSSEVKKLQWFLKNKEGFLGLEVNGVFDINTYSAVSIFQNRYKKDILAPWGISKPTGNVHYTTLNKINELLCGKTFNLTNSQKLEISNSKAYINGLNKKNTKNEVGVDTVDISTSSKDTSKVEKTVILKKTLNDTKIKEKTESTPSGISKTTSGTTTSTTTKKVNEEGFLSSVFSSIKNGVGSVFSSIFKWGRSKEEGIESSTGSNNDEVGKLNISTTTKVNIIKLK